MNLFPPFEGDNGDLEYEEFVDMYDSEIYCAYMESGAYYDTDREMFEEYEYSAYLSGLGQWAGCQKISQA